MSNQTTMDNIRMIPDELPGFSSTQVLPKSGYIPQVHQQNCVPPLLPSSTNSNICTQRSTTGIDTSPRLYTTARKDHQQHHFMAMQNGDNRNKSDRDVLQMAVTPTTKASCDISSGSPQQPFYDRNGGVLQYSETIQSFFQINENSTEEYRSLCTIIDSTSSSLEQKASAWRRLLEIRTSSSPPDTTTTSIAKDLLRLHRRATSYFTSVVVSLQKETPGVPLSHMFRRDLLRIWLSYATVQAKYNNDDKESARMTIRHIQNQSYLTDGKILRDAAFYIVWSKIEETSTDCFAVAESILREGIRKKAEPIIALHDALRTIQQNQQLQKYEMLTRSPKPPSQNEIESPFNAKQFSTSIDNAREMTTGSVLSTDTGNAPSQDSNMSLDTEEEVASAGMFLIKNSPSNDKSVEPNDSIQFQLKAPISGVTTIIGTRGSDVKQKREISTFDIPVLGHRTKNLQPTSASKQPPSTVASESDDTRNDSIHQEDFNSIADQGVIKESKVKQQSSVAPMMVLLNKDGNLDTIDNTTIKNTTQRKRPSQSALSTCNGKARNAISPVILLSSKQNGGGNVRKPSSTFKRPPLQFKTFGLGKAERIDPSQSMLESDSDEDVSKTGDDGNKPTKTINTKQIITDNSNKTPSKKPKISKLDLDYMWNWDPEKRKVSSPLTVVNSDNLQKNKRQQPQHQTGAQINNSHGTPSVSLSSNSSSSTTTKSSSDSRSIPLNTCSNGDKISTPLSDSNPLQQATQVNIDLATNRTNDHSNSVDTGNIQSNAKDGAKSNDATDILRTVNSDFIRLIQESNIIQVNQEPYVKLGVIGKGGSCKVYRALSKDCSVLAIKKVKIDDLDKKAIDGYANEIALLKRLRGNPSIIQLHDSEVDMKRQVILLVMEAGEADLNHVLQKQTASQGSSDERTLNMNFIRLTWQVRLCAR
jgi:hypothetical protein